MVPSRYCLLSPSAQIAQRTSILHHQFTKKFELKAKHNQYTFVGKLFN